MVLFDDAFGKGQTKPPTSFFGCITWVEDGFEVFARKAFACVGYFDISFVFFDASSDGY